MFAFSFEKERIQAFLQIFGIWVTEFRKKIVGLPSQENINIIKSEGLTIYTPRNARLRTRNRVTDVWMELKSSWFWKGKKKIRAHAVSKVDHASLGERIEEAVASNKVILDLALFSCKYLQEWAHQMKQNFPRCDPSPGCNSTTAGWSANSAMTVVGGAREREGINSIKTSRTSQAPDKK
jgi:hypothetical protein